MNVASTKSRPAADGARPVDSTFPSATASRREPISVPRPSSDVVEVALRAFPLGAIPDLPSESQSPARSWIDWRYFTMARIRAAATSSAAALPAGEKASPQIGIDEPCSLRAWRPSTIR